MSAVGKENQVSNTETIAGAHKTATASHDVEQQGKNALSIDAFDIGKPLGRGKYGSVYLARVKSNKKIVAIKVMFKEQVEENEIQHQIKREIEIQSRLKHPHILKLRGFFTDEKRIYMVMEYAKYGSMYDILKKRGALPEDEARRFVQQMCSALFLLQKHNIIHRDLKLENLMVGAKGKDGKEMIKIGDFGWAVNSKNGFSRELDRRQTFCGTLDYLAPEMVDGGSYNELIDMWSLGVLAYEFLHGESPFAEQSSSTTSTGSTSSSEDVVFNTCSRILKAEFSFPETSTISQNARDFICRLLMLNPSQRMGLKKAIAHPWLLERIVDSKKYKEACDGVMAQITHDC